MTVLATFEPGQRYTADEAQREYDNGYELGVTHGRQEALTQAAALASARGQHELARLIRFDKMEQHQ